MRMFLLISMVFFLSQCIQGTPSSGQRETDLIDTDNTIEQLDSDYKKVVLKFYEDLLDQNNPSISDYYSLFGSYALEEEEYKFFERCEQLTDQDCDKEANKVFGDLSNHESLMFLEIRQFRDALMPDVNNINEVRKVISEAEIYDTGFSGLKELVLEFSQSNQVYFQISGYEDEQIKIQDVFLPSGESIFNPMGTRSAKAIKRLAVINDPDGYTYVRDGEGTKSSVLAKIQDGELFFYSPITKSNWYKVQLVDSCNWGYMHKSRVKFYGELDGEEKAKIDIAKNSLLKNGIPCYQ